MVFQEGANTLKTFLLCNHDKDIYVWCKQASVFLLEYLNPFQHAVSWELIFHRPTPLGILNCQ